MSKLQITLLLGGCRQSPKILDQVNIKLIKSQETIDEHGP